MREGFGGEWGGEESGSEWGFGGMWSTWGRGMKGGCLSREK